MSLSTNRIFRILSLSAAFILPAFAASKTNPQISIRPKARILEKVDVTKVTTLANTHSLKTEKLTDLGRVPSSTPMGHMLLVLKSSPEQEQALQTLLDQQQDKSHPNYHQWMTPETFGAAFGVASSDMDQVKGWLQQSGFSIDEVAKSNRIIMFSGTAGEVESAFHTEIHQFQVNGETRIANTTDISIPSALTSVVAGPARLDNFRPQSHAVNPRKVHMVDGKVVSETPLTGGGTPLVNAGPDTNFVGAGDLQVLYDTTPLYAKGIDGTGQTVGIIAETDILPADYQIYRSMFGLPPNPLQIVRVGVDSGISAGDDVESDLDVEMAGALAYNANIQFITAGESFFGDGVLTSALYAAEANQADVISMSYGECESSSGSTLINFFSSVWEQAASQGQTVFVSSGDSGPDTCAADELTATTTGYSVTGWGESPYNVSVGGTEFDESLNPNFTFWNNGLLVPPYTNAVATPPEVPWNQSSYGDGTCLTTDGCTLSEGSSGVSFYFNTPSWQTGPGVPTKDPTPGTGSFATNAFKTAGTNHRYVPDISANASDDLDGTILCSEGSCTVNSDGSLGFFGVVGGTSVSSPMMASAQALINQANGGRQGLANYYYYRVAAAQNATNCNSDTYVSTATSTCGFHDVTSGNNYEPTNSTTIPYIGWTTNPGYDMAVGLGSPDVAQLAALWSTVTFNATTTTLSITPATGSAHGATYTANITITPTTSTSTFPTGQVSLVAEQTNTNGSVTYFTLTGTSNSLSKTFTGLPGGTYQVYAHYTGDTNFGGSNSAPVTVTVGTETPKVLLTSYSLSTAASITATSSFPYGTSILLQGGINPTTGVGIPTGTATYNLSTGSTTLTPLTVNLEPTSSALGNTIGTQAYTTDTALITGNASAEYGITPNYGVLSPGTYTASLTYNGDSTFNTTTSTPITFTVGQASSALTVTLATAEIPIGGTAIITASVATVATLDGGALPTGTVTFTDTTTNTPLGSGKLVPVPGGASAAFTVSSTALTTAGSHTISVTYTGDTNYSSATKTATITLGGTPTTITLVPSATTGPVLTPFSFKATLPATSTGSIYFYDGTTLLSTVSLGRNGGTTATFSTTALTAGKHNITAVYGGSTTLDSVTSSVAVVTVTQNQPALQLSVENNNTTQTSGNTAFNAILALNPSNVSATTGAPFAAVPTPTGTISFTDSINGKAAVALGTAALQYQGGYTGYYVGSFVATSKLVPGYHTFTATYQGDANYEGTTSNTDTLGIGITTTTVSFIASGPTTASKLQVVATVTPVVTPVNPAVTGTVTFYLGSTSIGTGTVLNGTASVSINFPGANQPITAIYSGDTNYYTSTSAVTPTPGYVLSTGIPTFTLNSSGFVTSNVITATPIGNYVGTGSLTCATPLPTRTTCTSVPVAFTFTSGGGAQSYTYSFSTTNPSSAGFLLWLPAMMLAGLLFLGRKRLSARGQQLMVLAILFCGMMAITGCGNSAGAPLSTTHQGTVTLTSTGTSGSASSPNFTTTVSYQFTTD